MVFVHQRETFSQETLKRNKIKNDLPLKPNKKKLFLMRDK